MTRCCPLLFVLALGCGGRPESDTRAASAPQPQGAIEYAGCLVTERGARCELEPDRKLRFWLPGRLETLRLDGQGSPLPARRELEDGSSYELQVPAGVRRVEVRGPGAV